MDSGKCFINITGVKKRKPKSEKTKKGVRVERNAWLTDMVPTICYLMNWPVPEHAEGAVLYQIFEDPNFRLAES